MHPIFVFLIILIVALLGTIRLKVTVFSEKQRKSKLWFIISMSGFFLLGVIVYYIVPYFK